MSTGPKAAFEAVGGAQAVVAAADAREDGAQLDMLAESDRLDEQLPIAPSDAAKRGPGRPAGARNKRTEALASYYLRRHGDPLEALLTLGMGSIEHTAVEFAKAIDALKARGVKIAVDAKGRELSGVDLNELVKVKVRALEAALPYLHARRAPVDGDGETVLPVLNIGVAVDARPGAAARRAGGGLDIEAVADAARTVAEQGFQDGDGEEVP